MLDQYTYIDINVHGYAVIIKMSRLYTHCQKIYWKDSTPRFIPINIFTKLSRASNNPYQNSKGACTNE